MPADAPVDPYAPDAGDGPVALAVCPSCGAPAGGSIYAVSNIPVQLGVLLDTEREALDFPCGDLNLVFCEACGFIFNSLFDARLLDYTAAAEESQHFSATFGTYARGLAEEIVDRCAPGGRTVLEIGCGRGDFLAELAARADCRGIGIDPGFKSGRLDAADTARLDFISDYFGPSFAGLDFDIAVCRHTLEHIGPVAAFLRDLRTAIGDRADASVFFETPDAGRVLAEGAFWDIYYEHCSYFTAGSHARLFRQEGFRVTELRLVYGDQYIIQFAEPGDAASDGRLAAEEDLDALRRLAAAFPQKVRAVLDRWRQFVSAKVDAGQRIAIWGGGSKCVSFITSLDIADKIAAVVDVNPFKQGKYLPAVGHRIDGPQDLAGAPPDVVIVMNPIYLDEIRESLADMGLAPEMVAV